MVLELDKNTICKEFNHLSLEVIRPFPHKFVVRYISTVFKVTQHINRTKTYKDTSGIDKLNRCANVVHTHSIHECLTNVKTFFIKNLHFLPLFSIPIGAICRTIKSILLKYCLFSLGNTTVVTLIHPINVWLRLV